jgi:hypothetical protein
MTGKIETLAVTLGLGPGPMTQDDFDEPLIQAVIDFANMGLGLATAHDVEALFSPFARERWVLARPGGEKRLFEAVHPLKRPARRARLLGGPIFEAKKTRTIGTYKHQQRLVREILDCATAGDATPEKAAEKLNFWVEIVPIKLGFIDGKLVHQFRIESVMEGWALALVVLHDSERKVRACEECNRYYVIFQPKGHQQRYCPDCAEDARKNSQLERQRRFREKKRKELLAKRGKK